MITLIFKPRSSELNYILIAGGISENNKILQTWELYDPNLEKIVFKGEMSFATTSGKLVTYEKNIVFRIGGYCKKSNS